MTGVDGGREGGKLAFYSIKPYYGFFFFFKYMQLYPYEGYEGIYDI